MVSSRTVFLAAISALAFSFPAAGQGGEKIKSCFVYGIASFAGKTPVEVADTYVSWGFNHVVFGGMPYDAEPVNSIIKELKKRGVTCYGETQQFAGWGAFAPPTLATGEPMPQIEWYQGKNPSDPAVFQDALDRFKGAVDRHPDLDGVITDFCRWPIHWEVRDWKEGIDPFIWDTSFDAATLARFEAATGIDIPDSLTTIPAQAAWIHGHVWDQWGQWKCSIINDFAKQASTYLHSTGATKKFGACTVPWKVTDLNGAILKIVGVDYKALSEWVEVFAPMTYYDMMDYTIPWIGDFATYCNQLTGRTTIPIIMAISISKDKYGDVLTPGEFAESVSTAANASGSSGVCLFYYDAMVAENRYAEVVSALSSLDGATAVQETGSALPGATTLRQNAPNPFNASTTISFDIARPGKVTVEVLTLGGQRVATLVSGPLDAGSHSVTWTAPNSGSGVYLCKVTADGSSKTMKMALLK